MSYSDDEDIGGVDALGFNKILQDVGIDLNTSGLSSVFGSNAEAGGSGSRSAFASLDNNADDDKYEDISDSELPEDSDAQQVREKRLKDEERWYRKAMAMQAKAESGDAVARRKRKAAKRGETAIDTVGRIWPEWEKGKRLRMSEVFYQTPATTKALEAELRRRKRGERERVERESCCSAGESELMV